MAVGASLVAQPVATRTIVRLTVSYLIGAQPQRCGHRPQSAATRTRSGCIDRCDFVKVPSRIGERDLCTHRKF